MTDVADREGEDEQGEAPGGDSDSHFRQVEIVEEEEEAQRQEGQADEDFEQRSHPARLYGMSRPRARSMSSTEPMTGPTTGGRRGHATEDSYRGPCHGADHVTPRSTSCVDDAGALLTRTGFAGPR